MGFAVPLRRSRAWPLHRRLFLAATWHPLRPSPPCPAADRSSAISLRPEVSPRTWARSLRQAAAATRPAFPAAEARPECVVQRRPSPASAPWGPRVRMVRQASSVSPELSGHWTTLQDWAAVRKAADRRAADRRAATAAPDAEARPAVARAVPEASEARAPEQVRPRDALGPAAILRPAVPSALAEAGVEAVVRPAAALALPVPVAAEENQAPALTAALGSVAVTIAPGRLA